MAKLRHLALWTRQPEKMAEFHYAKARGTDPDGNLFDLSTWDWSGSTLPKDKGGPEL